jgi:DNA-binding NtrC family response regulator
MGDKIKIMLVDDEPIVGNRLGPWLEKQGYHVEIFLDGKQALERFEQSPFDIVVTDIRMAEVDGIQVLDRVMEMSPRTKVIVITGYALLETARETQVKGAFDFIAKPFHLGDLRQIVNRAIDALRSE